MPQDGIDTVETRPVPEEAEMCYDVRIFGNTLVSITQIGFWITLLTLEVPHGNATAVPRHVPEQAGRG